MARIAQDDDLLIVNRNGVDYKATVAEVRPPVCELEELPEPPPPKAPWEGAVSIFHVIVTDPAGINPQHDGRYGEMKIYDKDTRAELSSIEAAGEYIIAGFNHPNVCISFEDSTGTWEFGSLTDTSKLTNMSKMFRNAEAFNGDVSRFDTSNVGTMYSAFHGAKAFTGDISGWDTGNVEDMSWMFCMAEAFNRDIGGWDTSSVGDELMQGMFKHAAAFDQDLSGWSVKNFGRAADQFDEGSGFEGQTAKQPQWSTCPRGEDSKP